MLIFVSMTLTVSLTLNTFVRLVPLVLLSLLRCSSLPVPM